MRLWGASLWNTSFLAKWQFESVCQYSECTTNNMHSLMMSGLKLTYQSDSPLLSLTCKPSYLYKKYLLHYWIIFCVSILCDFVLADSYIAWLSVWHEIVRLTVEVNQQPRRSKLNKHMSGVVYCDNRFNWVLAPLHRVDSCCSLFHIPKWAVLPSLTVIWQWDAHSTSQELH